MVTWLHELLPLLTCELILVDLQSSWANSFPILSLSLQPYMMLNLNRYIRYTLTRFRYGVSDIKVHSSRFKVCNVDELKCPLCLSAVDNEVHFVPCCPEFDDLRYKCIDPKYCNNPCEFWLALLLATQNEPALKNLALCIKHAAEEKPCYREELKRRYEIHKMKMNYIISKLL